MDLQPDERAEELCRATREFCASNWPLRGSEAQLPRREQEILFRRRAIQAGILARMVPKQYGGAELEADIQSETLVRKELEAAHVPWRASPQGPDMLVPTLLEEGTPEQCLRYIPPTLVGEITWCQGYSEPGSGSDLASLHARAELDGDEWVITGQKIWTSNATEADYMFGLFRTEPDVPRHGGISYLLIDMKTPGVQARPVRQMNGSLEFCEVFFDGARIPAQNIVGARGEGWKVSKATLKHERMLIGDFSYLQRGFDDVVALARRVTTQGRPAIEDAGIRRRLAEIEGFVLTQRYSSYRILSAVTHNRDLDVIGEMMMTKLYLTNATERIAKLALDLLGEEGLRASGEGEAGMQLGWDTPGRWISQYMISLGLAIAGGTSNIQRNLIGERILGLPRDPRPPKA